MKIFFLGTRGYIDVQTPLHFMHSSLMVEYRRKRIMFDCGEDWLGKFRSLEPDAIFITHAHPDHAWGLKEGADCPVYASAVSWEIMKGYPVPEKVLLENNTPEIIGSLEITSFPLIHSIRAPAVGYRISSKKAAIFYAPDIVAIVDRKTALSGVSLYIGDGATPVRSMVRRRGDELFGHTPIRTQITWCMKENVSRALFTHCGAQIVAGDDKEMSSKVEEMGKERGVEAGIAYDGMKVEI
jgi:phosphoribosyl 1,2-cyclic phosphodiesterase